MKNYIPRVNLGELLALERRPVSLDPDTNYSEIGVYSFGRGIFHKPARTGLQVGDKQLYRIQEGDFILQITFAWEGAVALASAAEDGMYGSVRFLTFHVDTQRCFPRYLLNYFRTHEGVDQLARISPGSAGRNRVLSVRRIPEVMVPLPSVEQQRRTVARIEESSIKIEEARHLRKSALAEARALVISETRKVFADPSIEWRHLTVEDSTHELIDYRGRTPPISETGIPHVTSANIKNGKIDWHTTKYVSTETYNAYMTRGLPEPGDVIFTMEAPLGDAAVVPDHRKFSLAQRTLLLRPKASLVYGDYLARVLTSPSVHEDIYSKATGTTVKGIASKRLRKVVIPIPPRDVQRRIVTFLDDVQAKVDLLKQLQERTSNELSALMPSILSKAFAGEL